MMYKLLVTFYGVVSYIMFISVFLYAEGFLLEIVVAKSINSGEITGSVRAIVINLFLILAFGFFHSLMSRDWFKKYWIRVIPQTAERSTYVLQSSLFLALLMWQWHPMPDVIWSFDIQSAWPFYTCFVLGNIIVLWSTFLIDHFELFGLRQVWSNQKNQPMPAVTFKTPSLYKIVRHPMHLGVLLVFWSTPLMTSGHLLFALSMTVYVLIGVKFEERSLRQEFGENYAQYQRSVPKLIPRLVSNRQL